MTDSWTRPPAVGPADGPHPRDTPPHRAGFWVDFETAAHLMRHESRRRSGRGRVRGAAVLAGAATVALLGGALAVLTLSDDPSSQAGSAPADATAMPSAAESSAAGPSPTSESVLAGPTDQPSPGTEVTPAVVLGAAEVAQAQQVLARAGVAVMGEVVRAHRWQDDAGDNVIVLSRQETVDTTQQESRPTLHVLVATLSGPGQAAEPGTGARESRRLVQPADPCVDGDFVNDFVADSVRVSDTDGDGFGEVSVAWGFTCATDVSPIQVRLAVIERGSKYIVRGTGYVDPRGVPDDAWQGPVVDDTEPRAQAWPVGTHPVASALFRELFH